MDKKLALRDWILKPGSRFHVKQLFALQSSEKTKKKVILLTSGATRSANFGNTETLTGVADYLVKPYIPYVWRYFLDFLLHKRNTD